MNDIIHKTGAMCCVVFMVAGMMIVGMMLLGNVGAGNFYLYYGKKPTYESSGCQAPAAVKENK